MAWGSPSPPGTPPGGWPLLGLGLGVISSINRHVYKVFYTSYLEKKVATEGRESLQHLERAFGIPEGYFLLLEGFSKGGIRRPCVSTRSGSTWQKVSRLIETVLLRPSS